jgi:protein TonB
MRHERISHVIGSLVCFSALLYFTSASEYGSKHQALQSHIEVFEYYQVEELPRYRDSLSAFDTDLYDRLKWPNLWHGEGDVVLSFIVSQKGTVEHIRVEKGLCDQCDVNAVDALAQLEDWKPGVKNGKLVATRMYVRVRFVIR